MCGCVDYVCICVFFLQPQLNLIGPLETRWAKGGGRRSAFSPEGKRNARTRKHTNTHTKKKTLKKKDNGIIVAGQHTKRQVRKGQFDAVPASPSQQPPKATTTHTQKGNLKRTEQQTRNRTIQMTEKQTLIHRYTKKKTLEFSTREREKVNNGNVTKQRKKKE
jgi:hypothetical protein